MKIFFAAELTKNTGQRMTWEAEMVGVVTMTKKVITFFDEKLLSRYVTSHPGQLSLALRR